MNGRETLDESPCPMAHSNEDCLLARPPELPFINGVIEGFYGKPWSQLQRRQLLRMMRQLGMNTYVYAPKDDLKHRQKWRELYDTEQAGELQSHIEYASSIGVNFVYALSPGNDIEYSNAKDVTAVKQKIDQLRKIGCVSFALLFDDIEYKLSDADSAMFGTPANAQVAVVNDCYAHANAPAHFFFCPTEYCSTRAKPTLLESDYLRTIGDRLHPGIQIFWTGPLVVPRYITAEHAHAVSMVLKRKPLIWDNLFANDYDMRRLYLGPFGGRPIGVRKVCSGLLINPNCQWEANFVPIQTYGDWLAADIEVEKNDSDDESQMDDGTDDPLYNARISFEKAVQTWLKDFNMTIPGLLYPTPRAFHPGMCSPDPSSYSHPDSPLTTLPSLADAISGSPVQGATPMEAAEERKYDEPMDRSPSISSDVSMMDAGKPNYDSSYLTFDQLVAFCHVFYQPFAYGEKALEILNGFMWLYRQAGTMTPEFIEEVTHQEDDGEPVVVRVKDVWLGQMKKVTRSIDLLTAAFHFMQHNKPLQVTGQTTDFVKYASDVHGILCVLEAVIDWMRTGHLRHITESRPRRWERPAEIEAWHAFHAFVHDVTYAMLPLEAAVPLIQLLVHKDEQVIESVLRIRLIHNDDVAHLEPVLRHLYDTLDRPSKELSIIVQRFFRPFLQCSPALCFYAEQIGMENQRKVLGTICGILNVNDMAISDKTSEKMSADEDSECSYDECFLPVIPQLMSTCSTVAYPSFFDLRIVLTDKEMHSAKRLIQTLAVVLSYQGSTGMYTSVAPEDREKVNLLLSLHFTELDCSNTDQILLGLTLREADPCLEDEEQLTGPNQEEEEEDENVKKVSVDERGDEDD